MIKCQICNKELEKTFLDKLKGTLIKIKKNNKITEYYVCNLCQKKFRLDTKKEVEKLIEK